MSASGRSVQVTILFADVLGFTALLEAVGAEPAYLLVTRCLSELDRIAHRHGGSVDKYQGDAMMVAFGHPRESDSHAADAVRAGIEMRGFVDAFNRAEQPAVPLDLQIGINTGSAIAGELTGTVVREFHLVGDTVNVAARFKSKAPPGSIYTGVGTQHACGAEFHWRPVAPLALRGKSRRVEAREVLDRTSVELEVDLAAEATSKLADASLATASDSAERRRATILFSDLTGFTAMTEQLGAETAYPIIADCLELLAEIARRHGGSVEKFLGDCVMAVFGVPRALEDAPRAAVNAAIEMRRRIRAYGQENGVALDLHAGIHTGQSIAGELEGSVLRELAVMGEPVKIADELTGKANAGEILLGPTSYRLTQEQFEFRDCEPVELAWRSAAVAAHQLQSDREQLHRRRAHLKGDLLSTIVGREAELSRMGACLERLAQGQGGYAAIVGEAGLGKSRLIEELRRNSTDRIQWLEGRSLSVGSQFSFHPFADLLRSWAGVSDEDDDHAVLGKLEARLVALLPKDAEEMLPFLATMMGAPLDDKRRERVDSVQTDQLDKLFRAHVTRLLVGVAEQRPLLLVFDDLHWADQSSLELLESLQRLADEHPIGFLHVFRPGFADTSGRILEHLQQTAPKRLELLELRPLDPRDIGQLINNLLRGAEIPQRLRAKIAEQAAGNPFYVEEVTRTLFEAGAIERRGDLFVATERMNEVEIPSTIQEVVMARIDRLEPRERQVLQVAAVAGRSFHFEVLRQLFPEKEELLQDLTRLRQAGFVVTWDRSQGVEFAFKHPLLQETAYDSLLQRRREALHRAVGNAIEASLTPNIPGYYAMLAYHFSLGRDSERAEEFLFRAGDEAARTSASSEAVQFFQGAAQLYFDRHGKGGDPAKKARLERAIGLGLHRLGRFVEAEPHLNAALRYLGERVPEGDVRVLLRFAWNLPRVLLSLYLPEAWWPRRVAKARDVEVLDVMMRRAEAQTYVSPPRFFFDSLDTLARLDQLKAETVPKAGSMYASSIGIFSFSGISFRVGKRFLDRAQRYVRRDDVGDELGFRVMNYVHCFLRGDWVEAHRIDTGLLSQGLNQGFLWGVITYLGLEAERCLRQGEFEAAHRYMEDVDEIWKTYDYDLAKTNHYWLATCDLLERRKLREAVAAADAYHDENPEDILHVLALSCKAHALTLLGELEEAENVLERCSKVMTRTKYPPPYHASCYRIARLQLDLEQWMRAAEQQAEAGKFEKAATRSARQALAIASRVGHRRPEIYRLAARAAWLSGRKPDALKLWNQALEEARRLGARPELARAAYEASQASP